MKGDILKLRPEVEAFAQAMEATLRRNDHKHGWKFLSTQECVRRLNEESTELLREVEADMTNYPPYVQERQPAAILKEACDVANFAMFAADVAGALDYELT